MLETVRVSIVAAVAVAAAAVAAARIGVSKKRPRDSTADETAACRLLTLGFANVCPKVLDAPPKVFWPAVERPRVENIVPELMTVRSGRVVLAWESVRGMDNGSRKDREQMARGGNASKSCRSAGKALAENWDTTKSDLHTRSS